MTEKQISSERLFLEPLTLQHDRFIFELVNTKGWIEFIGDRQVKSVDDAASYIKKILQNDAIRYWVVRLKNKLQPVGIVTYIRRDYLDYADIGFAFLPEFVGRGYAYEST